MPRDTAVNKRDKFLPSGIMGNHGNVLCGNTTQSYHIFKRPLWLLRDKWVAMGQEERRRLSQQPRQEMVARIRVAARTGTGVGRMSGNLDLF